MSRRYFVRHATAARTTIFFLSIAVLVGIALATASFPQGEAARTIWLQDHYAYFLTWLVVFQTVVTVSAAGLRHQALRTGVRWLMAALPLSFAAAWLGGERNEFLFTSFATFAVGVVVVALVDATTPDSDVTSREVRFLVADANLGTLVGAIADAVGAAPMPSLEQQASLPERDLYFGAEIHLSVSSHHPATQTGILRGNLTAEQFSRIGLVVDLLARGNLEQCCRVP